MAGGQRKTHASAANSESLSRRGVGSDLRSLLLDGGEDTPAGIGMEDGAAPAAHSSEELSAIQSELSQLRAELGVEGGGDSVARGVG